MILGIWEGEGAEIALDAAMDTSWNTVGRNNEWVRILNGLHLSVSVHGFPAEIDAQ